MRGDAAVAQQVVADDAVGRRRPHDADQVGAEAAVDLGRPVRVRAEDEEAVVARASIDNQALDVDEVHVQARAEHAVGRDHEVVVELSADDDYGVEAVATVDVHRRVDRVLDQVCTRATAEVGERAVVLLRSGEREGLDQEDVVACVAVQVQRVEVVEDDEVVVADPAVDRHRLADAVAQPALRGLDGGEDVLPRDARQRGRAARLVQLADLEEVVALAAVDRDRGARVVHVELVVTGAAVDGHRLEVAVVVDALDRVARLRRERGRAVDQSDERETSLARRRAQQEHVGVRRAVDRERVGTVTSEAGVEDVDQRVGSPAD